MTGKVLWALGALNAALLGSLLFDFNQPAQAQVGRGGDYIMIPAEVSGGNGALVYMIDTRNHLLSARTYDQNTKRFGDMPVPINLDRVLNQR